MHACDASTISYKSEEFYFRIDRNANSNWVIKYCPGDKKWVFGPDTYSYWDHVLGHAKQWAGYVAGELEAKSYLELAMNSPQLLKLPETKDENTPFSELEQQQLIERLDRIEEQLLGVRGTDDVFRVEVRRNFQCLRDEVARGGRTAFRYTLFGALLSIGLAFLSPNETQQIIDFAAQQIDCVNRLLIHSGN